MTDLEFTLVLFHVVFLIITFVFVLSTICSE